MIHQTDAESPKPVAEAESLVGVASTDLFCLFAGGCYYPMGGASDFRGFGTVDELKALYAKNNKGWDCNPWGHICKHATMEIVFEADHRSDGIHWQNAKGHAPRGSEPAGSPENMELPHKNEQTTSSGSYEPPCSLFFYKLSIVHLASCIKGSCFFYVLYVKALLNQSKTR